MASLEVEEGGGSKSMEVNEVKKKGSKKRRKNGKRNLYFPKLSCFRIEHDATGESFDMKVADDDSGKRSSPTHLIIMVNGLIGRFVLVLICVYDRYYYDDLIRSYNRMIFQINFEYLC